MKKEFRPRKVNVLGREREFNWVIWGGKGKGRIIRMVPREGRCTWEKKYLVVGKRTKGPGLFKAKDVLSGSLKGGPHYKERFHFWVGKIGECTPSGRKKMTMGLKEKGPVFGMKRKRQNFQRRELSRA